jgi:hypothetical protein
MILLYYLIVFWHFEGEDCLSTPLLFNEESIHTCALRVLLSSPSNAYMIYFTNCLIFNDET